MIIKHLKINLLSIQAKTNRILPTVPHYSYFIRCFRYHDIHLFIDIREKKTDDGKENENMSKFKLPSNISLL